MIVEVAMAKQRECQHQKTRDLQRQQHTLCNLLRAANNHDFHCWLISSNHHMDQKISEKKNPTTFPVTCHRTSSHNLLNPKRDRAPKRASCSALTGLIYTALGALGKKRKKNHMEDCVAPAACDCIMDREMINNRNETVGLSSCTWERRKSTCCTDKSLEVC